jgi:hypothetical protein
MYGGHIWRKFCQKRKEFIMARKSVFMKKSKIVFLGVFVFLLASVFAYATSSRAGHTYEVAYKIVWDDTREEIESGTKTVSFRNAQISVEGQVRKELGFSGETKKVGAKVQRVVILSTTDVTEKK